jgi:hypothetical protein
MSLKLRLSFLAVCLVAAVSAGCKSSGCSSCGAKAEPAVPTLTEKTATA